MTTSAEQTRLTQCNAGDGDWRRWGPYLSDRAWGTVREDYSADGDAWNYFPHDHARSRAYRWNEDGIGGFCDEKQHLCLAVALWNEKDPILKERMFGLSNPQGNHGEDVKEYYFFLDGTPTHSYMRMLYKYPQAAYPYDDLVKVNGARNQQQPEYELFDALGSRLPRQPLLRRHHRVRQGEPRGHPLPDHGRQSRPRRGAAPYSAPSLVSQPLVVGSRRRAPRHPRRRAHGGVHQRRDSRRALVVRPQRRQSAGRSLLHRERNQLRAARRRARIRRRS